MATENLNFGAEVDAWVQQTEQRMLAVFRESTKRMVSKAQSRIPVDTGFARASVRASTQSMPSITSAVGAKTQRYGYDPSAVILTIAGAQLGQTIYVGWTAAYVQALEYGHSKQAPSGFIRITAAEWQVTVNEVVAEAKVRAAAA